MSLILEETNNLEEFIGTLNSKFEMSDELVIFLKDFIENSDCEKIEFADFKYAALGAALHNGVLINKRALYQGLEFALFVIFHEIAHQYQYKKYGKEKMYEYYNDEISVDEAAKLMKKTEEIADSFAVRKIRELQKMGLINGNYKPIEMYKNLPEKHIAGFISDVRNKLRERNLTSPDEISEYYYNLIKSNI